MEAQIHARFPHNLANARLMSRYPLHGRLVRASPFADAPLLFTLIQHLFAKKLSTKAGSQASNAVADCGGRVACHTHAMHLVGCHSNLPR